MRIIGGKAAGAILKVPKGLGVRPTPDKVRLAIFNSLGPAVENTHILEVFAGTGALGLEALSRGARSAVFVELSSKHARVMQQNHKKELFNRCSNKTGHTFSNNRNRKIRCD